MEEAITGYRVVRLNAYIFEEVMRNLERADLPSEVIERAQTDFAKLVHQGRGIEAPSREAVSKMDLEEIRESTEIQMLGEALSIQPKDVPILSAAFNAREDTLHDGEAKSIIYTADFEFSRFTPRDYFTNIEVEYVSC